MYILHSYVFLINNTNFRLESCVSIRNLDFIFENIFLSSNLFVDYGLLKIIFQCTILKRKCVVIKSPVLIIAFTHICN